MWIVATLWLLALVHVYWAWGGRWPGIDGPSLAARVVGGHAPMPGWTACMVVAGALLVAGAFVGSALASWGPLISEALDGLAAGAVAVAFGLRGLGGFFEVFFRPTIRTQPYFRLNLWLYSPLCLVIAAGIIFGLS